MKEKKKNEQEPAKFVVFYFIIQLLEKPRRIFPICFFFYHWREKTRFFHCVSSLSSAKSTLTSTLYPDRRYCLFISSVSTTQKCSVQERWVSLSGGAGPIDQFDTHKEIDSRKPNEISTDTHTHTHTHCVYIVAYTYFVYLFKLRVMIVSYLWAGNFACPIFLI
jgi:hypothetical protein